MTRLTQPFRPGAAVLLAVLLLVMRSELHVRALRDALYALACGMVAFAVVDVAERVLRAVGWWSPRRTTPGHGAEEPVETVGATDSLSTADSS